MIFQQMYLMLQNVVQDEEGQDLIEYALLVVLIVILGVAGMATVGGDIAAVWTSISGWLTGATT